MEQQDSPFTIANIFSVLLLFSFGIVLIAAGHGVGPMCLVVIFATWGPSEAGSFANLALVFCCFIRTPRYRIPVEAIAIATLIAVWVYYYSHSDRKSYTLMSSTFLAGALLLKIGHMFVYSLSKNKP